MVKGCSFSAAVAFAGLATAVAAAESATATTLLYLVKAPFSPYQSPPFSSPAQVEELSYSNLPGLLAHAAGATKKVAALDIQQWAGSAFFSPSFGASVDHAVAAINLLGVEHDIIQQILPMVEPAFLLKNVPSTSDGFEETMTDVTESIAKSSEFQLVPVKKTFASGAVEAVLNEEPADAVIPSPRPASEVVVFFVAHFPGLRTDLFNPNNEIDAAFISEVEYISDIFAAFKDRSVPQFTGVVMGALQGIASQDGVDSKKYDTACQIVKELLTHTVIPKFLDASGNGATVAVLMSHPTTSLRKRGFEERVHVFAKRQVSPTPTTNSSPSTTSAPTGTPVECPKDQATCESQTNKCNGRGQCVKNKLGCFRCKCSSTADPSSKSTTKLQWAGDACEYRYAAPQFFLLWGTGIAFVVAVLAVSILIITMGGAMDSGPMAGAGAGGLKTD